MFLKITGMLTPVIRESMTSIEKSTASLHKCTFFPYQPATINSIATTPSHCLPQVAVLRATEPSSIEIWTPGNDWAVEKIIHGKGGENFECMAFVGPSTKIEIDSDSDSDVDMEVTLNLKNTNRNTHTPARISMSDTKLNLKHQLPLSTSSTLPRARFFTAGVDGRIREWNMVDGCRQEIFSVDVNGGSIWSLAVSPDQETLAVGCEDGRVRLFSIYQKSIEFLRGFEANEDGRIQTLAWNENGDSLVSGSVKGSLKVWNCENGRAIHSLRLQKGKVPSSIWSVCFGPDNCIVSGDSTGNVQFRDFVSGTLLQSFPCFGADVLSVHRIADRIFATGVDHKIVEFSLVQSKNAVGFETSKWIQGGKRHYHTHDVRALASLNILFTDESEKLCERVVLLSGGVDCNLVVSSPEAFDKSLEKKKFNSFQRRFMPFARNSPLIRMATDAPVLVGRMNNSLQVWRLDATKPTHLADVNISRQDSITSFAISPEAKHLCVLTPIEGRLFALKADGLIEKYESFPELKLSKNAAFPHIAHFLNESTLILLNSHEIFRINLTETEMTLHSVSPINSAATPIRRISLNPSKTQVALCYDSKISTFSISSESITAVSSFNFDFALTALSYLNDSTIVASDIRNAIFTITTSSKGGVVETFAELPSSWKSRREPIMGIIPHPTISNKISCWTDSSIGQLTFPAIKGNKRKSHASSESNELVCRLVEDYRPILFFSQLPNGDSVVVERPWISIVENFPPAYYRSRYGAQ